MNSCYLSLLHHVLWNGTNSEYDCGKLNTHDDEDNYNDIKKTSNKTLDEITLKTLSSIDKQAKPTSPPEQNTMQSKPRVLYHKGRLNVRGNLEEKL